MYPDGSKEAEQGGPGGEVVFYVHTSWKITFSYTREDIKG
jgi:hypothetical protein